MSILPVLDLKDERIVRGIAGQRSSYRPIESQISPDSLPVSVARAFVSKFDFRSAYVADLDAIAGQQPSWDTYHAMTTCGLRLMIDAGIGTIDRARLLRRFADSSPGVDGIIVGMESVGSIEFVRQAMTVLGPGLGAFSLDLKLGKPLTAVEPWRRMAPLDIASEVISFGIGRLIVLDLAAVGVGRGPVTTQLCRELRNRFPALEIISGGGIRGASDVAELLDNGCDRVLVASALHDGRLIPDEIKRGI